MARKVIAAKRANKEQAESLERTELTAPPGRLAWMVRKVIAAKRANRV